MRVGTVCVAYNEPRMIVPHLKHIPDWVDEKIVLNSTEPWFGEPVSDDKTAQLAEPFARVIQAYWESEESQRNTGQALHQDKDWIIVLDPDEYLDNDNWEILRTTLEQTKAEALIVEGQYTYWKNGLVADPPKDYPMLIAVRPSVQFVDKRVVSSQYEVAPIWLHHFSWAKTDAEVWSKISHYAHAHDFDIKQWYNDVWLADKLEDVHPVTPNTLHKLIPAKLPPELEELNLWP